MWYCLGLLPSCWWSASFWAVEMVIFWGRENFGKKSKDIKNVTLYNFFTFLFERSWADFVLISSDFRRFWAGEGLRVLYITPFPLIARSERVFKRYFQRVLRLRLPSCGRWWVLSPSSCEKVGLYICISRYSEHSKVFFKHLPKKQKIQQSVILYQKSS